MALEATACGSVMALRMPVSIWVRSCSNSLSGNVGWRRTVAASSSSAGRFSRSVVATRPAVLAEPPMFSDDLISVSRREIAARSRPSVPRVSMAATTWLAVARSVSDASSPMYRWIRTCTASPRVDLASSASSASLSSVDTSVRASMLAGEGSNASPAAIASRPW